MSRILLSPLLAALLAAAPVSDDDKGVLYYPTREGAVRVTTMTVSGGGGGTREPLDATETVTRLEGKDGKYRVTTEKRSDRLKGKGSATTTVEVSAAGLVVVAARGKEVAQPAVLLKLPAKAGDTWESPDGTRTVGKVEEEVEVPAGRFKAVAVVHDSELGGRKVRTVAWFAPGVGLVKSVTLVNGFETTHVLKSFTPGK